MPRSIPTTVEILWGPETLLGPPMAVVDLLRVINSVAAIRHPRKVPPVAWRWRLAGDGQLPRHLPRPDVAVPRGSTPSDILFLPGWHARNGPHLGRLAAQCAHVNDRLCAHHARGGAIVAIYNACAWLGQTGLLDGLRFVGPWPFLAPTLRIAPLAQPLTDRAWEQDRQIWTCDSPVLATELIVDALQRTPAGEFALAAAQVLVHTEQRQLMAGALVAEAMGRPTPAGVIERARRWLQAHVAEDYDVDALARASNTSVRTLLRHFASETGQTPVQYLHGLRMARACMLLETTYLPIEQVAQASGYAHLGTFRRQFQLATATQPATYRQQHRLRSSRHGWGRDQPG